MRRAPVLLTLLLVLVGTTALADPAAGGEPPPPDVEVTDVGTAPRRLLRLDVSKGDEFTTSFTLRFGLEQEIEGETRAAPIPPIRYELASSVTKVNDVGRVTYTFTVEELEAVDDGTVEPSVLDRVADELEDLAGLEGEVTVTARGVLVESDIEIPSGLDAAVRASLQQLSQQLSSLTIPYPRDRVGVGATWTATTALEAGGIDTDLVYSYELREFDGNAYVVGVGYEQTAEPQDVDLPGVPDDAGVRLEEFDVSGSGEMSGELTSPLSTSGTLSAAGDQVFTADDEAEELRQSLSIDLVIESRRGE
jgi:hypothetical protein